MTLVNLKADFESFRNNREHKAIPFPKSYWKAAAVLVSKYGEIIVRKELNITRQQILRYCSKYLDASDLASTDYNLTVKDKYISQGGALKGSYLF